MRHRPSLSQNSVLVVIDLSLYLSESGSVNGDVTLQLRFYLAIHNYNINNTSTALNMYLALLPIQQNADKVKMINYKPTNVQDINE